MENSLTGSSTPVFSVIVPTFGRPAALARCLRALNAQSYAEPFEVIVVNDGGAPLPDPVLSPRKCLRLTVLQQTNSGPAAARNLGCEQAAGKFLAFTDDDCEPATGWLAELARHLEADPSAMVGGHTVNALPENSCSAASQLLIDFLYASYVEDGLPRFFTSNNMAMPRGAFLEAGRFDPSFPLAAAEDREFCWRWRHAGRRVIYAPAAIVNHWHDLSFRAFMGQQYRYGRGAWQFRTRRAGAGQDRDRVEPLGFYRNLLGYPFRAGTRGWAEEWKQAILLVVSQIVHTAGFFRERGWGSGRGQRREA